MQIVNTQRTQTNTVGRLWPRQLKPRCARAVVHLGAHRAENSDRTGESSRGERDDVNAGRIEPLQIVDGQQHRAGFDQPLDHRQERGRDRTLVGYVTRVRPQ